jgi:formylglycine-generating enzyme required for sulfatase activity
MVMVVKFSLAVAAGACAAAAALWAPQVDKLSEDHPAMATIEPGVFRYRLAGDFTHAGKPANAPAATIQVDRSLAIMKHQVTAAEYQRCVDDGACPRLARDVTTAPDRPAVKVNWHDANIYAAWLSRRTGARYRLPTDAEWAYAAGSRFAADALPAIEGADPVRRWLARYERESRRDELVDKEVRPVGGFGANENGIVDLAGNVWEWTSTCFVRVALDQADLPIAEPIVNCGVRVVEGRHRTYMTDFIRDPRTGGCAVGAPPSNLGFRLVREDAP